MTEINNLIRKLGIHATYRGYHYLAFAIDLAIQDENYLLFVTRWLYPDVAKRFQTTAGNVERNLRTIVTICWERGNRKLLESIAGRELLSKPTTEEFIDILSDYLKQESNVTS